MIEVKKYIGSFTGSVYSNYTHSSLSAYKLIFDCIFYPNETEKASIFFEKVDDFAYAGAYAKFNKSGAQVTTHFFLVRVNNLVGVVDEDCKVLIDIDYKEIIPPINADDAVFVVKNTENQWGVINAISNEIIVPFGKYLKIWGYDTHHALVCTKYENSWSQTHRAIIDVKGNLVKGTESYYKIYPFYGTKSDCILVETQKEGKDERGYRQIHYLSLSKEIPSRWQSPLIESVEAPRSYMDHNYHPVYDKMDAYEDDYDALWNTD
ncbi:hypothetical protein [Bacteroides intestinalis]|jgi:hypothetical protein|uniref:hypothetical protein n=1 Tax=Bacteroides intestinalis TaxID=329854 RepID=UPI0022E805B8|nr:hypothetical protein [Bacteroides intestinalis]